MTEPVAPGARREAGLFGRRAKIPRMLRMMFPAGRTRRAGRWVALALTLAFLAGPAAALDPPSGKVVLLVSGKVSVKNSPEGAAFDLAQLEALPQRTFATKTPWYSKPRKFTGVLLRDVLAAVGSAPARVKAAALNDYRVEIPLEDIERGDAMLAYRLDDQPMTVREKGPLVVIYPFDDRPDLRSAVHYGRAIWQLRSLEVQ